MTANVKNNYMTV